MRYVSKEQETICALLGKHTLWGCACVDVRVGSNEDFEIWHSPCMVCNLMVDMLEDWLVTGPNPVDKEICDKCGNQARA